ncbi:patatin-like phospholipase family protein [Chitinimonas sp.]|uniref:patatin-like phospholipase family protein n=1 Tax=Chitinimonas sp. TaxID=1934313 RepID=UPI002F954F0C
MAKKPEAPSAVPQRQLQSIVLVLQGGGALGAYQAGVYEELSGSEYCPDWIAGVSIGAINAAIIAGNPPERRVARLREFWERVSSGLLIPAPAELPWRTGFNWFSSRLSVFNGIEGFYTPRPGVDFFGPPGQRTALSFYDNTPLRQTLLDLVDFDLINRRPVRLSLGAVDVQTGNSVYFDNTRQEIRPEHIMASGALPPAFAPVEIDGAYYWDGGIVSNTPLHYVLDNRSDKDRMVLQVDLFSARGDMPTDLLSAMARHKNIMYSSRTRYGSSMLTRLQSLKRAIDNVVKHLPPEMHEHPAVLELMKHASPQQIDLVQLIYRPAVRALPSADYEFSRASVLERWATGAADIRFCIENPDWLHKSASDAEAGVNVYDLRNPDPSRKHTSFEGAQEHKANGSKPT